MAKRNKIYYPATQIEVGLVTHGKEWMIKNTNKEYFGPYHKYSDGLVMSGGSYSETNSEYLIPYKDVKLQPTKTIYDSIKKGEDIKLYKVPKTHYPLKSLTAEDYKREYFYRYFLKRRNDSNSKIIEVTQKDYKTLNRKGSGINGSLYHGLKIRWKISGNKNNIKKNNVIIYSVSETNLRTILFNENKMSGLRNFLSDTEEFSIFSTLINEELIKGKL